jgi:hypothetical protein
MGGRPPGFGTPGGGQTGLELAVQPGNLPIFGPGAVFSAFPSFFTQIPLTFAALILNKLC